MKTKRHKLATGQPTEIERKFLVNPKKLPKLDTFEVQSLRQGYLHTPISVKLNKTGTKGVLSLSLSKGKDYKLNIPAEHVEGLKLTLEQRIKNPSVRIRLSKSSKGKEAWLTVKGKSEAQLARQRNEEPPASGGFGKAEYEYVIPYDEAKVLYEICDYKLSKARYHVPYKGYTWDVDEYRKHLKDLWTAEVELKTETEEVDIPEWCVEEVTGHPALTNHSLAKKTGIPPEVKKMQRRLASLSLRL
jgi:CYTH domain-containing protein